MTLFGFAALVAPVLGPTLGGWITFNYSWRWIFFINLPVGVVTLFLVYRLVQDPPYLSRLRRAGVKLDYVGIALLALGIGALQILLDKGQEDDWFGSHFILTLAVVAAVCLVSLVVWEWRHPAPIVDVKLFKSFNFASANLMFFMLGVLLFSSLVMMPLFLQTLLGYTAQIAGFALSAGGLVLLIEMPLMGQLTTKVQARYLIALGWLFLALGMLYSTQQIDLLISFRAALRLRVVQVIGIGFLFVPITLVAYIGVPADKNNAVAGIVNFMRNMGSSVGTSLVTTMLARRSQYHQEILVGHLIPGSPAFQGATGGLAHLLAHSPAGPPGGTVLAYARIYRGLQVQAASLAYIDTFKVLAVIAGIMFFLAFILKKNSPGGGGEVAVG